MVNILGVLQLHYERRLYQTLIESHFRKNRQMLFLMGPRQVGKTTLCLQSKEISKESFYFNWDNIDDRALLLKGPGAIAKRIVLDAPRDEPPLVIFDEIHKYGEWKTLLKGFFDTYSHSGQLRIIVTGSARLDAFNEGGDSLMGRYFRYRIHPFSVAELLHTELNDHHEKREPSKLDKKQWVDLLNYGGFPEPLFKHDPHFFETWKQLRMQQLFMEEVRDLTRIHEIRQMELLAVNLQQQVGSLVNYTNLGNHIRVSSETVRRWLSTLYSLYFCYPLHPWSKNVTRSLLKEPKIYLCDWAQCVNEGARSENFVGSQLLKAVHYWTDRGFGSYGLHFLRDKEKREVDFIVTKNDEPWFLVEVKTSMEPVSSNLEHFQQQTNAKHAFQVTMNAEFQNIDCFSYKKPVVVPAVTFLSQLF